MMSGYYSKELTLPPFQLWAANTLCQFIYNLNDFSDDLRNLLIDISLETPGVTHGIDLGNAVYSISMSPVPHINIRDKQFLSYRHLTWFEKILKEHENTIKPFLLTRKLAERALAKVMTNFEPKFSIYAIPSDYRKALINNYPKLKNGTYLSDVSKNFAFLLSEQEENIHKEILKDIQKIVQPLHDRIAAEVFLNKVI